MRRIKQDKLYSGGLIVNYLCSSHCAHCLYACSPKRERDYIDRKTCAFNLKTVKRLGCSSVHIGGGEPMLNREALMEVLDVANEEGVGIDYVETNSSWFSEMDSACLILERLLAKGLTTLLISISPYHNAYIPFSKVKGVMQACRKTGMGMFLWQSAFINELEVFDDRRVHSLEEYQARFGKDYLQKLRHRFGVTMGGSAIATYAPLEQKRPVRELINSDKARCARLADSSHFHVDLYGKYLPGLCVGLYVDCRDLGTELDPDRYPVITALYNQGVEGLLEMACSKYGFTPDPKGYTSTCELCSVIRMFMVLDKGLASVELGPSGFYKELKSAFQSVKV